MRCISQVLLRICMMLLALIAGCGDIWGNGGEALYGVYPPSTPPDPDLQLVDLSYEPASPIADGEELVFTATMNKPSSYVDYVHVKLGGNYPLFAPEHRAGLRMLLFDNGNPPDATAGDGVFTGLLKLPSQLGPMDNLSVVARVEWFSTATLPVIQGDPLSILAPEEEE